ncbi:hypothetical protein H6758_03610 [Candidatus Nomurabacteria bacterium]|nr:hypothetical protein [Candidatus Nomurabacteria bacterium]
MKNKIQEILAGLQKIQFEVVGPFLVADFSQSHPETFDRIAVGTHGMEKVGVGEQTEGHTHGFLSVYKSKKLSIVAYGRKYLLPEKALTIVPPGVDHSWVPNDGSGEVGSSDNQHEKQVIVRQSAVA